MQTFVIRVQRSADEDPTGLRGVVEEIATGTRVTFRSGTELLSILMDGGPAVSGRPSPVGADPETDEPGQREPRRWSVMVGQVWRRCLVGWLVAGTAAAAPSVAAAVALHPRLLARSGYGFVPVSFARTPNGTLHVALATNMNWGDTANGVGVVPIGSSGHVGPFVQALTWTGAAGGSPSGIPGVAAGPGDALAAVFPGSPSGDPGPWAISSADGGSSWSAPADVGSGAMEGGGAMTLQISHGTPVMTEGCCGGLVVQQGFGSNAPTYEVLTTADGVAGNVDSALDAASGAVVASWDSAASPGGLWFQQVAPSLGAAVKLPVPSQYGEGQPLILAGRDGGPGVFAAYPANYASTTRISLARYGGPPVAVGRVKDLHADAWGAATGPDGRIWVFWSGIVGGQGITAITRSNVAATRFEPIQRYVYNWSGGITMSGDGRLGPLDMLISGTPSLKSGQASTGIYYARVLAELSARVAVKRHGHHRFALAIRVTDAGDAAPGAVATARGRHASTGGTGVARLVVRGRSGARVAVRIADAGYNPLTLRVRLR